MKTRNKIIIISGIILLVFVLTGYGLVSAYGPWNGTERFFKSGFHGRGFHPGVRNGDMSEFLFRMMDKEAGELKLTDTQLEKHEVLKANIKEHLQNDRGDHQTLLDQLYSEMNRENPDVRAMAENIRAKITEMSEFADESLDLFINFYDSLDASQQRLLIDGFRERMRFNNL